MLTKNEIKHLLETRPELVGEKLFASQQRVDMLLGLLNEMNQQMIQIRLEELAEAERDLILQT